MSRPDATTYMISVPETSREPVKHPVFLPEAPSVSVIVPVHNGGAAFRACLASLQALDLPPLEIIVVADGDTDGSRDVARASGVHVIECATPGGPARARNRGARAARGDLLFFVDADVTVPPDAIAHIQRTFRDNPELIALIGSYDDAPAAPQFLSQYRNLLHHYVHQTGREQAFTFWGACGAIRRDVFLHLGGFDERYHQPSIEDIELGYRLVQHGYQIHLLKSLQVKHHKRWSAGSILRTDVFQRALPWTELIMRKGQLADDLNLQRSSRWSVVCAYGALASLIAGVVRPGLWIVSGISFGVLVALNLSLYRFFAQKRGVWFAARAIPWHWLYYLYSGFGFVLGSMRVLGPQMILRLRTARRRAHT